MKIHKEGYPTIILTIIVCGVLKFVTDKYLQPISVPLAWLVNGILLFLLLFVISFFRLPKREHTFNENAIIAPADGKVVVIEETVDEEYFHEKRLQISVFMSPANVHVNRNPISGKVLYSKYHKGKYLVAWDPKSSTENERHSVVLSNNKITILVKQIAGAVARRIVNYSKVDENVKQNNELGFIKFGSRVDLLLPTNVKTAVKIGDVVQGGVTVLAHIS